MQGSDGGGSAVGSSRRRRMNGAPAESDNQPQRGRGSGGAEARFVLSGRRQRCPSGCGSGGAEARSTDWPRRSGSKCILSRGVGSAACSQRRRSRTGAEHRSTSSRGVVISRQRRLKGSVKGGPESQQSAAARSTRRSAVAAERERGWSLAAAERCVAATGAEARSDLPAAENERSPGGVRQPTTARARQRQSGSALRPKRAAPAVSQRLRQRRSGGAVNRLAATERGQVYPFPRRQPSC